MTSSSQTVGVTEPPRDGASPSAGVDRLGTGTKVLFALLPLILLYAVAETVLSAVNFAPFTASPENAPIGTRTVRSPWGDERRITEQIFIGAHARFELPFYFRAFVPPVRPKPPGLHRIVLLGDSFIFGSGVADHETLPFQLGAFLRHYQPELGVETINLGLNGGGPRTYFALREVADRYDPDLVVVAFTMANDFLYGTNRPSEILAAGAAGEGAAAAGGGIERDEGGIEKGVGGFAGSLLAVRDFVLPKSRTLSAVFRPIRKIELGTRWDAYMERTYAKNHEVVFDYLGSLGRHYEERGVPLVLLIYPFLFSSRHIGINDLDAYRYQAYHDAVRQVADSVGFRVVEVMDYFRRDGIASFDGYQIDGDGHPNGAFNAVTARYLATDLLSWSLP